MQARLQLFAIGHDVLTDAVDRLNDIFSLQVRIAFNQFSLISAKISSFVVGIYLFHLRGVCHLDHVLRWSLPVKPFHRSPVNSLNLLNGIPALLPTHHPNHKNKCQRSKRGN